MKVGPENSTNQNGGKVSTLSRPDSVIERLKIEDVDDQGNNGLTIGNCYVSGTYKLLVKLFRKSEIIL